MMKLSRSILLVFLSMVFCFQVQGDETFEEEFLDFENNSIDQSKFEIKFLVCVGEIKISYKIASRS